MIVWNNCTAYGVYDHQVIYEIELLLVVLIYICSHVQQISQNIGVFVH